MKKQSVKKRETEATKPVPAAPKTEPSANAAEKPGFNFMGKPKQYWLWMGLGALLLLAGVGLGYLWMADQRNSLLALATIAVWGSGGYLIYRQLKGQVRGEDHQVIVIPGENIKSKTGSVNSLNIYAKKDDSTGIIYPEKIAFEWVEDPRGQPQKCLNTGKWYYVHLLDIASGKLIPFTLPDIRYSDPALMARYLDLPAQKKYMRHRESLGKYIGPGILAVLCVVGFIVIIALGG